MPSRHGTAPVGAAQQQPNPGPVVLARALGRKDSASSGRGRSSARSARDPCREARRLHRGLA